MKKEKKQHNEQVVYYDEAGEKETFNQLTEAYQSGVVEQLDEKMEETTE